MPDVSSILEAQRCRRQTGKGGEAKWLTFVYHLESCGMVRSDYHVENRLRRKWWRPWPNLDYCISPREECGILNKGSGGAGEGKGKNLRGIYLRGNQNCQGIGAWPSVLPAISFLSKRIDPNMHHNCVTKELLLEIKLPLHGPYLTAALFSVLTGCLSSGMHTLTWNADPCPCLSKLPRGTTGLLRLELSLAFSLHQQLLKPYVCTY